MEPLTKKRGRTKGERKLGGLVRRRCWEEERSQKGALVKGKTTHMPKMERGLGFESREQLPNQWGARREGT